MMGKREKIKVLISGIGLDGHSIGAEVVCRILMDAGMEESIWGSIKRRR